VKGFSPSRPKEDEVPVSSDDVPLDVEAVYRAHAQRVARWAARLAGPTLDVDDLVQEVFLIVQRELRTFRGDARLTTWLFRITENVVRHRRRKDRVRRWLMGSPAEVAGRLPSPRPTPLESLEQRQATELVYRALDGLPEKYRTVLVLFELEELGGDEIAALLGLKLATVWVQLHRARARFLSRLEELEVAEARASRQLRETIA
jgi:RNA polymerase sigma-70 factor (ECF subfamily)